MKIVIIGGVAGGASAAARARRLSETAEIILLEKGEYISYANCGLPYFIGGEITAQDALTVQTPEKFRKRFRIDVRTRHEAVSLDAGKKQLMVFDHQKGVCYTETYDQLLLSPGAKPVLPPIEGIDNPRIFTLRTIPDTLKIKEYIDAHDPKSVVIAGGGFIGIEMAENLSNLGIAVTICEMSDHIPVPLDPEMAADIHRQLQKKGIRLLLNQKVVAFDEKEKIITKTEKKTAESDFVVFCAGVTPNTEWLRQSGIALDTRGAILVDDTLRTSQPDIYAVGDAVAANDFFGDGHKNVPLAGPANKQGRIAADAMLGKNVVYRGAQGSAILKIFEFTAGMTGLNERQLKTLGIKYHKVYLWGLSHASYYPGAKNMQIKMLFSPEDERILGVQIVGKEGVDKRLDVFAAAMRGAMGVRDLCEIDLHYAPPYASAKDPVNVVGYMAENILDGLVRQFYYEEIACIAKEAKAVFLDVREPHEFARGHLAAARNIPLDALRARLSELDTNKTYYVNCQSGLRSYVACRILSENGFDCKNLAGGYRLVASVLEGLEADAVSHPCGLPI